MMSLKQLGSLTLVALCLAACSSGGGGSSGNLNAPDTGNNNNANNKHTDKSVSKLISVAELRDKAEIDLQDEFGASAKLSSYAIKLNGKTYTRGNIDLATLGNGFKRVDVTETASAKINGQTHNVTQNSKLHLYQQPYSVVASMQTMDGQVGNLGKIEKGEFEVSLFDGQPTKTLPSAGSFNYKGVAFTEKEQGNLNYTINFDTKKGAGSISGINQTGNITLHESDIVKVQDGVAFKNNSAFTYGEKKDVYGVLNGAATTEKQGVASYELGIFGPNADEVAGAVFQEHDEGTVGFGGKKQ
ncbi:lipoprotein GNA1870 C terminal like protein [Kingella oralis ATCC 51147]|uniref:Lipoprotein GNA1870 C terminal like protein n=3 Tax=Kingella TaxID=32257 RepID=C4GLX9_9NEIS|nr:lipoprotein GNA1870 C terminal like protein [Kingella oralis ATCC 51147]